MGDDINLGEYDDKSHSIHVADSKSAIDSMLPLLVETPYLYHGSKALLTRLEPRPSRIIDGEPAVFATNSRWLALVFISSVKNADLSIGFYFDGTNMHAYIGENRPDSFKMLEVSGYIYKISSQGFRPDARLGMSRHEFIKMESTEILETERIDNVWIELQKEELEIIPHKDMVEFSEKNGIPID